MLGEGRDGLKVPLSSPRGSLHALRLRDINLLMPRKKQRELFRDMLHIGAMGSRFQNIKSILTQVCLCRAKALMDFVCLPNQKEITL